MTWRQRRSSLLSRPIWSVSISSFIEVSENSAPETVIPGPGTPPAFGSVESHYPNLLNQNLHLHRPPEWVTCTYSLRSTVRRMLRWRSVSRHSFTPWRRPVGSLPRKWFIASGCVSVLKDICILWYILIVFQIPWSLRIQRKGVVNISMLIWGFVA